MIKFLREAKHWKIMLKVITSLQAPCDCREKVSHDNGGHYHDMIMVLHYSNNYYLLKTNTRELFPGDRKVIVENDDHLLEIVDERWNEEPIIMGVKEYDELELVVNPFVPFVVSL